MATDLDNLIQWLLDKIVSGGEDGVSISQILALIEAFYNEPNAPARREANIEDGKIPSIDYEFKSKVWRLLTAHADVSVGKDKGGNHLDLDEIEALPPIAPEDTGILPEILLPANGSNPIKITSHLLEEKDLEDPTSLSAQLLEQNQYPASQAVLNIAGNNASPALEDDQVDDKLVIHASLNSETGETVYHDGSEDFDGKSVTTSLKIQPRIYCGQLGQRMDINGRGVSSKKPPELESSSNPPKRRGRPPKVKNRESLGRRGRPPKEDLFKSLPSAAISQQTAPADTFGGTKAPFLETALEPKRSRGRQSQNYALFTSHDELQRDAGLPGVYFDLEEFEKTGIGRPRIKMIALFKSEKLKNIQWMKGNAKDVETTTTLEQTAIPVEAMIVDSSNESLTQENEAVSKKRNHRSEDSISDEPQPKRLLLDIFRNIGKSHTISYRSPYTSTSATFNVIPSADTTIKSSPLSRASESLVLGTEYHPTLTPVDPATIESSNKLSASKNDVDQLPPTQASQIIGNEELIASITSVGKSAVANATFQLPCSKDSTAGNLCLSIDKKSLSFIMDDTQKEISPTAIQILDIAELPETSPAGSETMVLRIIASSANGGEEIHEFRFLPTKDAFVAANSMRAKIVTAMMLLDLEGSKNIEPSEKPFKCSGCDGTWKNFEGLKYHQTKSKTSCNPNYIQKTGRRSRSNVKSTTSSREQPVLAESGQNVAPESFGQEQPAGRPRSSVQGIKIKNARSDPELQKAKDIIMALLDANGQIFPGEKSLWFALVASSLQKFPNSALPSYDVCNGALDLLEGTGRVRRVQFSFKGQTGLMKMRTVVTGHDVDPTSTAVVAMKENIKSKFPEHFIPLDFEPPKVVQSMLEERQNRIEAMNSSHISRQAPEIFQRHESDLQIASETLQTSLNPTSSCKVTRSGRVSRRPQSLLEPSLVLSTQTTEDFADMADDDSYAEDLASLDLISQRRNTISDGLRKGKRSRAPRGSLIGSNFAQRSPLLHGANVKRSLQMIEIESLEETDSENPKRKCRKHDIRQVEILSDRAAMWHPALSYLQNWNGSWNVETQPRVTRKYRPRAGLPEPITYLQTLHNSAWKFRPYGHGVRPIHARPAKRTEGQTAYLTKIRSGFRPVMMPTGEIFIPDMAIESPEGVPTPTKLTREKRKYIEESPMILDIQENATGSPRPSLDSVVQKRKYSRRTSNISKAHAETHSLSIEGPRAGLPDYSYLTSVPRTPLWNGHKSSPTVEVSGRPASFNRLPRVPFSSPLSSSKYDAQNSDRRACSSLQHPVRHSNIRATSIAQGHGFSGTTVRFLAPNTELGWEPENLDLAVTAPESRQTSISIDSRSTSVEPRDELVTFAHESEGQHSIKWQNTEILTDHNGFWPVRDDKDFNVGSFTVLGWFPSTADFLRQLLPVSVNEIVSATRSRKVIPENYPDPEWAAFLRDVEAVEKWEQGKAMDLLQTGTVSPDYIFMHYTFRKLECSSSGPVQIQWLDQNNLTFETFPYQEFGEFNDAHRHEELISVEHQNQQAREVEACEISHKVPTAQYMMASRRLTALPADLDGLQYSLADHPDMKVEVAVDHQHNVRKRSKEGSMSSETEFRLMVAVVVIRTLTGGLDKQVDWVLVSKLFPRFPMNAVSKRWQNLYLQNKQMIERLGPDFQEFFLEAYVKGEVDPIDYDHLVDYDWDSLVDLAIERIDINLSKTTMHHLPDSRGSFDQMFTVKEAEHSRAWRDDYFSSQPPVYKRLEYSASEHNTIPISRQAAQSLNIDPFTVAKSWVRANTLTPSETYNPEFAARKLATQDKGTVTAATSALFESKVLMQRNKGRPTPNRGVEVTDIFAAALRKHLDATHLSQAAVFKAHLDAQFRAGGVAMVEWMANDGEILAITNLQAHSRIRLEPQGVPRNKFGLTGGGYQTKRMDKAILRFDMQILPTPSYIFDADLPILSALTFDFLPPRGTAGAIPVWLDIGENLIPTMWKKVSCAILATIAMRPGAVVKELTRIFSPALEEWEMRIFIEWGVRVGALAVLREGREGWNVSEWWWVIGGRGT